MWRQKSRFRFFCSRSSVSCIHYCACFSFSFHFKSSVFDTHLRMYTLDRLDRYTFGIFALHVSTFFSRICVFLLSIQIINIKAFQTFCFWQNSLGIFWLYSWSSWFMIHFQSRQVFFLLWNPHLSEIWLWIWQSPSLDLPPFELLIDSYFG